MNRREDQLDQKLRGVSKPTMSVDRKEEIHDRLMGYEIREEKGSWLKNLKGITAVTVSAIAVMIFTFMIFTGEEGGAPRSSHPDEGYITELSKINLHDEFSSSINYVGDNGAVTKMAYLLPGNDAERTFELQTKEEPYEIMIFYSLDEEHKAFSEGNLPETLLYNATAYFSFFHNLGILTIHYEVDGVRGEEGTFTITRQQMENLYGQDLTSFKEEEAVWEREVLEKVMRDEGKIADFYKNINASMISEDSLQKAVETYYKRKGSEEEVSVMLEYQSLSSMVYWRKYEEDVQYILAKYEGSEGNFVYKEEHIDGMSGGYPIWAQAAKIDDIPVIWGTIPFDRSEVHQVVLDYGSGVRDMVQVTNQSFLIDVANLEHYDPEIELYEQVKEVYGVDENGERVTPEIN
ncbi:DUF4825 domain-containing protein [Bacillus tianshenii]|uniref:DUF4825 domain-containing protein n=1 Tax=Sutcliffiella tianshenii TaxID=1463404 RepID=UPI001CD259EA|nr:DUF4825 domain-containing protein [Bacillus tianshenii]MCA1321190.1 DUF4825 domain-containing protein [Bacillus tianshenii]